MVVTPEDVKAELAFDETALGIDSAAFDSLIGDLIDRETERVVDEIDVELDETTTTATIARGETVPVYQLPLPNRPVLSVESIELADRISGPSVGVDDVIVESTHLELKPGADRREWPTKRRSITVEWTHGYPADETPEPIRGAITGLVRHALQEIESDGIESESIDGDSVSYELAENVVNRHLWRAKEFDEPSFNSGAMVI